MIIEKYYMIMNNKIKQVITLSLMFIVTGIIAKENVYNPGITSVNNSKFAAGCAAATTQTDLDINNVRAMILGGGDMWWNLENARYAVPKESNLNSMFAGALWIGGVDAGGQLKVAAMTYRQGGSDFWTGPLNINTATITEEECNKWDKHFKIEREMVDDFYANWQEDGYVMPEEIEDWPGNGDQSLGQDQFLAPFFDLNGNGIYEPYGGDYPDYNVTGNNDEASLYGDQTLWWVFNDKGNIHSETEAEPLGLEIHAQAFAFASDDEVNDMTFYNYVILNRSTLPLYDTYFGQWVDPDLGFYLDDYVGCDVSLGLGFCYNGDAEDEGAAGYGFNPPAIGVDFFQGPLADAGDGIDNDRDGTVDEYGEQIIMSKFVYYNNDFTVIGNPSEGSHFYNYLRGIWKDNVPMTYGGDGHGGGSGATTTLCNFMFPGVSDDAFPGQEWTEQTAGNVPADRRFLQSAGPFTLEPGAVNEITTGVVWARASSGGQTASVELLKVFDKEAQALFDNNFDILNGPDAPDLDIRELDQELIFTLSNSPSSNNYNESYSEMDPYITKPINILNSPNYEFQGYLVYQLKDESVTQTNLDDPDLARLIFRSDIKDGVTGIINHEFDYDLGVHTPYAMVADFLSDGVIGGVDKGTQYSFQITEDRFATGSDKRLVNHKTYYFMSVAYGYNPAEENADPYNVSDPNYDGRNQPYIAGRRNIEVYHGIPHMPAPGDGGTVLGASYGDGVKITRWAGQGNGGQDLDLTSQSIVDILQSSEHRILNPEYKNGSGPINITVVDPVKVPKGNYFLRFEEPVLTGNDITSYTKWKLLDENQVVIKTANQDIAVGSEQYIRQLGLNIIINQASNPGTDPMNIENNGLISSRIEYSDMNNRWLTGLVDQDDEFPWSEFVSFNWGANWIRSGAYENTGSGQMSDYHITEDPNEVFETAIDGKWAPYRFVSNYTDGPGISSSVTNQVKLNNLHSVDVVFTTDKSKWTRCAVVEAQENTSLAIGGQSKMGLRQSPSVDKYGNPDNSGTMGMGWFPGYAINIETGERLNIIFAEDSWQTENNGADMKWNPTSEILTGSPQLAHSTGEISGGSWLMGGKHFIYVIGGEAWVKGTPEYMDASSSQTQYDWSDCNFSPNYDEGQWIYNQLLNDATGVGKWKVFKNATWASIPLLEQGKTISANDITVKLRVSKPYKQYESVDSWNILNKDATLIDGNRYVVAYQNAATTWGGQSITYNGVSYSPGESFVANSTSSFTGSAKARVINTGVDIGDNVSFQPTYEFNTDDIVAKKGQNDVAKDALELIRAVPNPYYGYSSYENSQLDNRIKITNLPNKAMISIFSISGTLIRTLEKDDAMSYVDWDLKNDYGIPIASGLYIIHVDAPEVGEKVIKWFGALRPIDLDTF